MAKQSAEFADKIKGLAFGALCFFGLAFCASSLISWMLEPEHAIAVIVSLAAIATIWAIKADKIRKGPYTSFNAANLTIFLIGGFWSLIWVYWLLMPFFILAFAFSLWWLIDCYPEEFRDDNRKTFLAVAALVGAVSTMFGANLGLWPLPWIAHLVLILVGIILVCLVMIADEMADSKAEEDESPTFS